MNDIHNKEKGLTAGALSFAFDSLFTCGLTSLALFIFALSVTGLNFLVKHIFTLLMIARYGHSGDSISLFPPMMAYQYLMRNGAYVDMEPAFLALFYFSVFAWLCLLIAGAHRVFLNYYDTGSIAFRPFISIRQLLYVAMLLAIPFALLVPEIYNLLPSFCKTIYSYVDSIVGSFFLTLILGSRFMLTGYFIVDKDKNPIQAMQASWTTMASVPREGWRDDRSWRLVTTMFIILNLVLIIDPFKSYTPSTIETLNLIMRFTPMFNTWLHCLMIGLMSVYAYRRFEKENA